MENKLNCRVIMLPTENISDVVKRSSGLYHKSDTTGYFSADIKSKYQYLYLVSDREIKNRDWVTNGLEVWQVKNYYGFQPVVKKIEATTDDSLTLSDKYLNRLRKSFRRLTATLKMFGLKRKRIAYT